MREGERRERKKKRERRRARCQWLTIVILSTGEAEIGRITVQDRGGGRSSQNSIQPIAGCSYMEG
jgi:hypothetical protein